MFVWWVCVCVHTSAVASMWKAEESFWELVLSYHLCNLGIEFTDLLTTHWACSLSGSWFPFLIMYITDLKSLIFVEWFHLKYFCRWVPIFLFKSKCCLNICYVHTYISLWCSWLCVCVNHGLIWSMLLDCHIFCNNSVTFLMMILISCQYNHQIYFFYTVFFKIIVVCHVIC